MAQCGPHGCRFQGGQSGYYDQYGQAYHGYQGSYPMYDQGYQSYQGHDSYPMYDMNHGGMPDQGYPAPGYYGGGHDFHQGQGYSQGGGYSQGHAYGRYQGGGYQGQSGMSQQPADHPVNDHNGQPIRYYGKPGPDYNVQGGQQGGGAQPQAPQSAPGQPGSAANQQTSYNYTPTYGWDSLADANTNPNTANRAGGTSSTGYPYGTKDQNQANKDSSTSKNTSTSSSKW